MRPALATDLFPGRDIATISQRDYADRLKLLLLPVYTERHRFAQFCELKGQKPDWSLFAPKPRPNPPRS